MMQFTIKTEADKIRAMDWIRQMPLSPVLSVEIDEYKRNRTITQNKTMWSWSKIIGDFEGYDKDTIKTEAVLSAFPAEKKTFKIRIGNEYEDLLLLLPRPTSDMTTAEISKVLDELIFRAHQNQLQLPFRDDYKEMMR